MKRSSGRTGPRRVEKTARGGLLGLALRLLLRLAGGARLGLDAGLLLGLLAGALLLLAEDAVALAADHVGERARDHGTGADRVVVPGDARSRGPGGTTRR